MTFAREAGAHRFPERMSGVDERVREIDWFHSIDLGDGIVTPGREGATAAKLERIGLPESLAGRSVLDVGAWDGFFAFEAERRGAERVLATDWYCWSGPGWGRKRGFDYARTFNPRSRQGAAVGIVNVGGFVASLLVAWAIGVVLGRAGGYTPDVTKVVRVHVNTFLAAHEVFA